MVQVTMIKNKRGTYSGFTCEGHAGYADAGEDVVCAAVSILVINAINSIEAFTQDVPLVREDAGKGLIECRFQGEICRDTELFLKSLVLGVSGIREQYGKKYVRLISN